MRICRAKRLPNTSHFIEPGSAPHHADILAVFPRLKSRFRMTAKTLVVISCSSVPRIEIVDPTHTSCSLEDFKRH